MASALSINELFTLRDAQVPEGSCSPEHLTVSSSSGICVCLATGEAANLTVVNTANPQATKTFPIQAQYAIQHRKNPNIVVLRTPTLLQTLDVSTMTPYGRFDFPNPIGVDYWSWATDEKLALVCPDAVYFWNCMTGEFSPGFARDVSLTSTYSNSRITDLVVSSDADWVAITALGTDQANHTQGMIQLYCFSRAYTRMLSGQCVTFVDWQLDATKPKTTLLAYAHKPTGSQEITINIMEPAPQVGSDGVSISGFTTKAVQATVSAALVGVDHPLFLRGKEKYGFLYMFSKQGNVTLVDIYSGLLIYQGPISGEMVFAVGTCYEGGTFSDTHDFIGITTDGRCYGIGVDKVNLVNYIMTKRSQPDVAYAIALRTGIRGADSLFQQKLDGYISQYQWNEAAELIKIAPAGILRTKATIDRFLAGAAFTAPGAPAPIMIYLTRMLENDGKLIIEEESMELAKFLIHTSNISTLESYIKEKRFFATEGLGDYLASVGLEQPSFTTYANAGCHEKAIAWLIAHNQYAIIPQYAQKFPEYTPDYPRIIGQALRQAEQKSDGTSTIESIYQFSLSITQALDIAADGDKILDIADCFADIGRVNEATTILLEVCKRYNYSDDTVIYQSMVIELNRGINQAVVDAIQAKGVLSRINRADITKRSEESGLYQRAFEFCDSDAECRRIASTYAAKTGKSIFSSPRWYGAYIKRAQRFSSPTDDVIKSLFAFQQQMLEITIGGERIYAEHVAMGFALSPIVVSNISLCVTVVKVFEKYGMSNSEALYLFLSMIAPACQDSSIHNFLLRTILQLDSKTLELTHIVSEDQYLDPNECFTIMTTIPPANPDAFLQAFLTLCERFHLGKKLGLFLAESISNKALGKDTFFTLNAMTIVEAFVGGHGVAQAHDLLFGLFEGGVLAVPERPALDAVFSADDLSKLMERPAVQAGCDINKVVDACFTSSRTLKVGRALLEKRLASGTTDTFVHTAFAKLHMEERNGNAKRLLIEDPYIDHALVGSFVLESPTHRTDDFLVGLAMTSLTIGTFGPTATGTDLPDRIVNGECARMLILVAYAGGAYKELAEKLLLHKCSELWQLALVGVMNEDPSSDIIKAITQGGMRPMTMHRDMLLQVLAHSPPIPLDTLNDAQIFVLSSSILAIKNESDAIPRYLQAILEKIITSPGSVHANNPGMQNLLIVTALNTKDYPKVSALIRSTEMHYDQDVIAKACVETAKKNEYPPLYEDAFEVFHRAGRPVDAVRVLLENVSIDRGITYANSLGLPDVWSLVGAAQLEKASTYASEDNGRFALKFVCDAITSYSTGKWTSDYRNLIITAFKVAKAFMHTHSIEVRGELAALLEYLKMARVVMAQKGEASSQAEIDTAIMYCLARLNDYDALNEFLESVNPRDSTVIPNRGGIKEVGEKCFAEEHYQAAKHFFAFVGDWSRLSLTLVKLRCLKEAVEAATRAADPECWKAVAAECLEIRDFELAKSVFLNLVLVESELPSIVHYYEEYGFIEELLEVLEAGVEQPQAATYTSMETNIFTILAILYCKYMWIVRKTDPQRLQTYIKAHGNKIHIPTLLHWTRETRLWGEYTYLLAASRDFDKAVVEMIAHPPSSFNHDVMKKIIGRVSNPELVVQVVSFYIDYSPEYLCDFLKACQLGVPNADGSPGIPAALDPIRVISMVKPHNCIPMIKSYLELFTGAHNQEINETLIKIYLESYDDEGLRRLISATTAYDTYALLDNLISEDQTDDMRKLAVGLYGRLNRYDEGIKFGLQNWFYEDAAECAANSGQIEHCEALLRLVCSSQFPTPKIRKEVFAVILIRCGHCIRPDVVMELAWVNRMTDYMMPYMISTLQRYGSAIRTLAGSIAETRGVVQNSQSQPRQASF